MLRFLEFADENGAILDGEQLIEEAGVSWLPRNLHDFLFHLSGPSDDTQKSKNLLEATLIDINRGVRPKATNPTTQHDFSHLPKTNALVQKAHAEMPQENLHKRMGQGLHKAFSEMQSEKPDVSSSKLKESKNVWHSFAKERGLKKGPKMLGGNLKTKKSSGEGVLTKGLSLAPHTLSGLDHFDVCPNASKDCRKNCLGVTAGGNKQYPDAALSSKVIRTHFLAHHPEHAARIIDNELKNHVTNSKKKGMIPGVRMNITSDISWEHHAPQMFKRHSGAQFYDYTKLHNRVGHPNLPKNYHLTLSHTGTGHAESNDKHVVDKLEKGHVAAMVYHRGKDVPSPTHVEDVKTGKRYPIANGDNDDNTFDRHTTLGKTEGKPGHGVVSGLKLKGVKNEAAGAFANKVDHDGVIRINKAA